MARKAFGTEGSALMGKARLFMASFAMSIFFNNTPLVAILLPVVKDWGRMKNIAASQLLMPLSYAVLAGSFVTMIGTSTNLTVQGLMIADRDFAFPFFAPAYVGCPLFVVLMAYMLFAGPLILPMNKSGLIRAARDKADALLAEVLVTEGSPAVGRSVSAMMSSLGLTPSGAIKIRRKRNPQTVPNGDTQSDDRSPVISDSSYVKKMSKFWKAESLRKSVQFNVKASTEHVFDSVVSNDRDADLTDLEMSRHNEDEYMDIIAPQYEELIRANDIVFISSAQDVVQKMMKSIAGESKGLVIMQSNVLDLPGFGSELVECIISDRNPFIGRKVSEISHEFSERYAAALITIRGKNWSDLSEEEKEIEGGGQSDASSERQALNDEDGNYELPELYKSNSRIEHISGGKAVEIQTPELTTEVEERVTRGGSFPYNPKATYEESGAIKNITVSDHVLCYGDVVLCVTTTQQVPELSANKEFFVVSTVGALPAPISFYSFIPVIIFVIMLGLVAAEFITMTAASLIVTSVFFIGGWIKPKDIAEVVDIRLLMIIACGLSFAKAMTRSGLALEVANSISTLASSPFTAMLLVYVLTLLITELISNNAAAALMYPIAVALADAIGVSFKPFAMCVLVASTACFMSPIGYQTHVMVWGPGGYRFVDFLKFGFAADVIYWIGAVLLIPIMYPY